MVWAKIFWYVSTLQPFTGRKLPLKYLSHEVKGEKNLKSAAKIPAELCCEGPGRGSREAQSDTWCLCHPRGKQNFTASSSPQSFVYRSSVSRWHLGKPRRDQCPLRPGSKTSQSPGKGGENRAERVRGAAASTQSPACRFSRQSKAFVATSSSPLATHLVLCECCQG